MVAFKLTGKKKKTSSDENFINKKKLKPKRRGQTGSPGKPLANLRNLPKSQDNKKFAKVACVQFRK